MIVCKTPSIVIRVRVVSGPTLTEHTFMKKPCHFGRYTKVMSTLRNSVIYLVIKLMIGSRQNSEH